MRPVLRGCYRVNWTHLNSCRYWCQILVHRTGKWYAVKCGYFLAITLRHLSNASTFCERTSGTFMCLFIFGDLNIYVRIWPRHACTIINNNLSYRGADKSLSRPRRKQATATKLFTSASLEFGGNFKMKNVHRMLMLLRFKGRDI